MSAESESADVFDFVDAYLADLERGIDRPLAEWLQRFPRSQGAIAREWLMLRQPTAIKSAAGHQTASGSAGHAADRMGPYRILRELGRGGQGTVFLAEDTRIARRAALKVLTSRFDSVSDEKRLRFRREAAVIARLEHPGLCTIHDADLDCETPWIAMRFIEGRTLAECLAAARASDGAAEYGLRLPPRSTVEVHAVLLLFERAARALHAAHEAGVVHRDIKPGNLIVALDGRPVLLDFGLARDETSEVDTLTNTGDVFGTPAYMSPEQLSLSSGELDCRTDVYSLGATLYEALTLERPFDSSVKAALYRAIQSDPLPDPRRKNTALGEDIKIVLETALEKDRARRYATALELAEDLRRIREYEPIHARPASVGLKFARWTRRHPAVAVATIGTMLALAIGWAVTLDILRDKQAALEFALGKHLAQRAVALSVEDPPSAVVLGIQGVELAPGELTRSSLFTALDACWLVTAIRDEEPRLHSEDIAVSSREDLAAIAFNDATVAVVSLAHGAAVAVVRTGPSRTVDMEFNPRGERLMTAAESGMLAIHDPHTGATLRQTDAGGAITCARYSPDGTLVAIATAAAYARILAADTLEPRVTLASEPGEFTQVRFAPDGRSLAAFKPGGRPVVFDVAEGRRLFTVTSGGGANTVEFTKDVARPRLLVGGLDSALHIFDVHSGSEFGPTLRFDLPPANVVTSPDGIHVAVLVDRGEEGAVYLCNSVGGSSMRLGAEFGRRVSQAAFSPDGTRLATTSHDLNVRSWDVATGQLLSSFTVPRRHSDVAWSRDGERLLTRSSGGTAQIWFARARPDLFELKGHTGAVRTAVFSNDGKTALTASADGTARLWIVDSRAGTRLGNEQARVSHDAPLATAAIAADDRVILTVGTGVEARTWNAHDGTPLRGFARHPSQVTGASLAPDGERFATVCADGQARLWSSRADSPAIVLETGATPGATVVFAGGGELVAVADARDEIRLYGAADGRLVRKLTFASKDGRAQGVSALAPRPGTDELAVGCGDQRLRCFSLTSGLPTIEPRMVFVFRDVKFSRDGMHALVTGPWGGGAVRSISFSDGEAPFPRSSHTNDMTSASYSDDAEFVLTTSWDRSARVWSTRDGTPIVRREGFASAVLCGTLSGAGAETRAIIGCADGRVSVWPIDPLPSARARALPRLNEGTLRRESELAQPLEFP